MSEATRFPENRRVLLCIVTGAAQQYGVGQVWDGVLRGFAKHGWQVVVAVLEAEHAAGWQAAYPDLVVVPAPRSVRMVQATPRRWSKLVSIARRTRGQLSHVGWLIRLVREFGITTLIVQSPPETLLAGIVARRAGVRALWLVPNAIGTDVPFGLNRLAYRWVLSLGKVAAVSNSRYTDSTFGPGSFERHVVHLGVDEEFYRPGGDPAPVREALGIPLDAPVIGLFARMTPSKGQGRLIEALAESGTPFHLLLCGGPVEGAYADHLRSRIGQLGLAGKVFIAGPQTDLRPYYAASDIVANMYVNPEGFGLTITEAMACAKPVLVHGLGGPSEIVTDGTDGWVLADVEIPTIAESLRHAIALRDAWPTLGRAGAARVAGAFGKDRFVRQIEELARRVR